MENIKLNIEKTLGFISKEKLASYEPKVRACMETLEKGTGLGNDFLGWLHLPSSITQEHLNDLKATAQVLRENCEVVVVAGIGGSYLGARAVIEAMSDSFAWLKEKKAGQPVILFAGHNIGEDYLYELTTYLQDKKFGIINISKSGTTTETALAFRLLKEQCERQRGKEMARKVIVAVTDAKKGAARTTADKEGYKSFIIPDNVGGRFSVLTPVGLLPIAVAGFDIEQLVNGAREMEKVCANENLMENPSALCCYPQRIVSKRKENRNPSQLPTQTPLFHGMVETAVWRIGRKRQQRHLPQLGRLLYRFALNGPMDSRRRTYYL